jgi:hypothetical protein
MVPLIEYAPPVLMPPPPSIVHQLTVYCCPQAATEMHKIANAVETRHASSPMPKARRSSKRRKQANDRRSVGLLVTIMLLTISIWWLGRFPLVLIDASVGYSLAGSVSWIIRRISEHIQRQIGGFVTGKVKMYSEDKPRIFANPC